MRKCEKGCINNHERERERARNQIDSPSVDDDDHTASHELPSTIICPQSVLHCQGKRLVIPFVAVLRRPASFDEVFTAFISDVHHDAIQIFRVSDCREDIIKVIKGGDLTPS